MAGELVLTPELIPVPDVDSILWPAVGVVLLNVPEGLADIGPCPRAVTTAGELLLIPVVPDVYGILCLVDGTVL